MCACVCSVNRYNVINKSFLSFMRFVSSSSMWSIQFHRIFDDLTYTMRVIWNYLIHNQLLWLFLLFFFFLFVRFGIIHQHNIIGVQSTSKHKSTIKPLKSRYYFLYSTIKNWKTWIQSPHQMRFHWIVILKSQIKY